MIMNYDQVNPNVAPTTQTASTVEKTMLYDYPTNRGYVTKNTASSEFDISTNSFKLNSPM